MLNFPVWFHRCSSSRRHATGIGLIALGVLFTTAAAVYAIFTFSAVDQRASGGVLVAEESLVAWQGTSEGKAIASAQAQVRFRLLNKGRSPVHILSVKSGCGCAKPVVSTAKVEPGKLVTVDVQARAIPVGRKDVPITLYTDSAINSIVELTLRIIGTHPPPFLFQIRGDMAFRGSFSTGIRRSVEVITVEPPGKSKKLVLSTDLPFLKIEQEGEAERPYGDGADAVLRTRTYTVGFTAEPSAMFAGSIIVQDPWRVGESLSVSVHGQFQSGLSATPSPLILKSERGAKASVIVMTEDPVDQLDVQVVDSNGLTFGARQDEAGQPRKVHQVTLELSDRPSSGSGRASLLVRRPDTNQTLTIPVVVVESIDR